MIIIEVSFSENPRQTVRSTQVHERGFKADLSASAWVSGNVSRVGLHRKEKRPVMRTCKSFKPRSMLCFE